MAFATDRDLLAVDPGVFGLGPWSSQRLVFGTGSVAGTTLTLSTGTPDFAGAGVGAGDVVLLDDTPVEVIERTASAVVTVSKIRAEPGSAPVSPGDDANVKVIVFTFGALLATMHRQALRMIGIDPDDPGVGALTEADVLNPRSLVEYEVYGTLHLIYAAVSGAGPVGDEMGRKAEFWRGRREAERQRVRVLLDLDGDGEPDASRRLNSMRFVRA